MSTTWVSVPDGYGFHVSIIQCWVFPCEAYINTWHVARHIDRRKWDWRFVHSGEYLSTSGNCSVTDWFGCFDSIEVGNASYCSLFWGALKGHDRCFPSVSFSRVSLYLRVQRPFVVRGSHMVSWLKMSYLNLSPLAT